MAFVKKIWKDRVSQYPNRRTINDGFQTKIVTVGRSEGSVTEAGDSFNAANMNDLEDRIAAATAGTYKDISGTLTAGNTSITLVDASISEASTIDYYTEYFGINPVGISVVSGGVTLTFEAQGVDLGVKVRVS